jgi:hypothetical protein
MSRGRSVEPELVPMSSTLRGPTPPNRFDRSRSAGPRTNGNRVSRLDQKRSIFTIVQRFSTWGTRTPGGTQTARGGGDTQNINFTDSQKVQNRCFGQFMHSKCMVSNFILGKFWVGGNWDYRKTETKTKKVWFDKKDSQIHRFLQNQITSQACLIGLPSRYLPPFDEDVPSPSDADRAMINQHVNPYQEFPSLR